MLNTRTNYGDFAHRLIRQPGVSAQYIDLADLARNGKVMGAPEEGIAIARQRLENAAASGNQTATALLAEISEEVK